MATRTSENLKKIIYSTLNNDLTLRTLLGGAGNVKHGNPNNLSEYPCVTYQVISEVDNIYDSDIPSNIVQSTVLITSFSNNTSIKQVDSIDDRVYSLLHGVRLSNSDSNVYSSLRVTKSQIYDDTVKVWMTLSTYEITNATP